jgi:hypothetical protein
MFKRTRMGGALLCSGALLAVAGVPAATAANQVQDGLVNVAIGDITVKNIKINVAAQLVAQVCGLRVGPVAVLATQVDNGSGPRVVCKADGNRVVLHQNH